MYHYAQSITANAIFTVKLEHVYQTIFLPEGFKLFMVMSTSNLELLTFHSQDLISNQLIIP